MNMQPENITDPPVAPTRVRPTLWIVAAAVLALGLKLCIALNTEGTNDVFFFYQFGRAIAEHGLEWTYRDTALFNHPPLVGYWLRCIYTLANTPAFKDSALSFPFLLRLPGILSDFAVVLIMLRLRERWSLPTWGLILLALSPVSIMVSGFHGNTDSVIVLCIVAAAYFAVGDRPVPCGIALAFGCGIKVVPLLLVPLFFFFWFARRRTWPFVLSFVTILAAISIEPLLHFPLLFAKNVLAYGSYWGIWGFTYWLRLTGWSGFAAMGFAGLPMSETLIAAILKLVIIFSVLLIAWRSRHLRGPGLFSAIAWSWLVFFIFAPGVGGQYLVWLMPFVLVMSPAAFSYITVASSCFLFFFYNAIALGLPWNIAISTGRITDQWTPWTTWPWLAFMTALATEWLRAARCDPSLRLFSLRPIKEWNH